MKGVNLGGWLVLEKWMTPSLFEGTDAVDEYTFMKTADAAKKLEQHRQTFVKEEDFEWLSRHGITAVRIPVGYWLFDGDDPYVPSIKYLDWAIKMAKKYRLMVLIDLHGAKGSQNGKDHSGRIGRALWYSFVDYRQQTVEMLVRIARRYKDEPTVWGLELMNEPRPGIFQRKLRRFYQQAYDSLSQEARPGLVIVFHDAFTPRLLSGAIRAKVDFPVMMDIHWYHFLVWFHHWLSIDTYYRIITGRKKLIDRLQQTQPVLIGEWSIVYAAETLQRRPELIAKRYMKRHAKIQIDAYDDAAGWFYWSYKMENLGPWHFRHLVESGIIT